MLKTEFNPESKNSIDVSAVLQTLICKTKKKKKQLVLAVPFHE